jgi:hypothetical protein
VHLRLGGRCSPSSKPPSSPSPDIKRVSPNRASRWPSHETFAFVNDHLHKVKCMTLIGARRRSTPESGPDGRQCGSNQASFPIVGNSEVKLFRLLTPELLLRRDEIRDFGPHAVHVRESPFSG